MNSTARNADSTILTFATQRRRDEHNEAAMRDMEWRLESDENYDARRDKRSNRTVRRDVRAKTARWEWPTHEGGTLRVIARHLAPMADVTQYTYMVIPPNGNVYDGYMTLPGTTRWSGRTPLDGTPQGADGCHLTEPPALGAWIAHLVADQDDTAAA